MNGADQAKLASAVERVLVFMTGERVQQLKVKHRDLHRMANLGNAPVRGLADAVSNVLKDRNIEAIFGAHMVVDYEVDDGEYIMVIAKMQKHINTLTFDVQRDVLGRKA